MNPCLVSQLADQHVAEHLRRHANRRPGDPRPKTPLRRRIGFVLIETGLYLVGRTTVASS